ncbi:hypothetical protein U8607_17370 [Methylobacterium durans]|uniref:Uncharacterized protein n=1 Tax=Methylobacterium durans TaxID=2202825 RepID=A0A2U8W2A7_9HYPH|nr:hypothetical protein [Methylobacterium durans]AWN40207.1 hypothetical protein DK389_06270 [Methylobacterium durans]MEA1833859.1 hypothetical protein [Methylobacterium durans]
MRYLLAGSLIMIGLCGAPPSRAQSIDIGPGGPSIDLRSRRERERDLDREEARREMRREQRRRDIEDDDDDDRPRRRY